LTESAWVQIEIDHQGRLRSGPRERATGQEEKRHQSAGLPDQHVDHLHLSMAESVSIQRDERGAHLQTRPASFGGTIEDYYPPSNGIGIGHAHFVGDFQAFEGRKSQFQEIGVALAQDGRRGKLRYSYNSIVIFGKTGKDADRTGAQPIGGTQGKCGWLART
jgi:hypothetical protein